ncbi:DUF739 domain-containing protein [Suicoccus acidiformans]|uniref:DUF739 domain-containing protein n=1 Tax=Suicoccus acidiformans TaxID=2036206 RepID=A0A347WIN3_9LACT|nr:DUF739 family protein [Suicoccus acidiformans]AXY24940.1 DUF739 domain-containing protein [Suicoccus acidiformans]
MIVEFDYSKLRGRIREKFASYKNLIPNLSCSTLDTESKLSKKLNGHSTFDSKEIIDMAKALGIPNDELDEYFFNAKVRKNERSA